MTSGLIIYEPSAFIIVRWFFTFCHCFWNNLNFVQSNSGKCYWCRTWHQFLMVDWFSIRYIMSNLRRLKWVVQDLVPLVNIYCDIQKGQSLKSHKAEMMEIFITWTLVGVLKNTWTCTRHNRWIFAWILCWNVSLK